MRILIVEDEELIRKGILSMVDWEAEGFSEVIECENAVDALDILSDRGADLVVTDLFMQSLSGFELIEMAHNIEVDTRFIILTGHGLFEYAQKAVELGVKRFLTKPVQPEELLALLREMRQEILEQQRIKKSIEQTQEKLREYCPIVYRQFWQTLVSNNAPGEIEARRQAQLYEITLPPGELLCVAVGISQNEPPLSQRLELQYALKEVFREHLVVLLDNGSGFLAIMDASVHQREFHSYLDILKSKLSLDIWLGISEKRKELDLLHICAKEAMAALKVVIGLNESTVSYYKDIKSMKTEEVVYPSAQEEKVLESLRYHDELDLDALRKFVNAVYECPAAERSLMLLRFQLSLYCLADSCGIISLPPFQVNLQTESRQEAFDRLNSIVECFVLKKASTQQCVAICIVEDAKRIMRENYSNPSLSISGIARQLYVSQQYLSRLFRSVSGVTCMNYLTQIRLSVAKELLRGTSSKSYEIAQMVGYNQPNYFCALFKKNTGMTPKQYRLENGD